MIGALLLALAIQPSAIPAVTPATAWRPAPSGTVVSRPLTDTIHVLAERVEIVRTAYGVPHILADDLKAMGFGLGYVQSEDYSISIAVGMIRSRGTLARHLGADELDADFVARDVHARAVATFHRLDPRTRDVYDGFAEGVNHYIRLHPDAFPSWVTPDFTGIDALARDVQTWSRRDAARFVAQFDAPEANRDPAIRPPPEQSFTLDGSNAWAFHGTRTASGHTILLRNPHLRWDGDHDLLSRPSGTVDYLADDGATALETRTSWSTPHGPVIHRTGEHVYLLKDPRDGEFRRGEQFLRMMMTRTFDEWLQVMRMRAHPTSNFTYADRAGNIAHYYNARLPLLPHPVTGDTAAVAVTSADIWSELVPWATLPLYINPPGGYVQQANDPPDYTNLNVPLDRDTVPHNLPERRLRLRSQLSLELAARAGDRLTLEDVVELKHSPRVLMAERVVDELVTAAGGEADPGLAEAVAVLEAWDRRAAADSRGAVLFERWAAAYFAAVADSLRWREPWDPSNPVTTPNGLGDEGAAVEALGWAVGSLREEGIPLDAPWGDIHRVIRGNVNAPVSGCPPTLGCFRVLMFEPTEDGRRAANRGDSWVLLVEFGDVPRAYTVLAYGQTARSGAPHYADQAAMFARGELKRVAWTEVEIRAAAIRRYRPGEEAGGRG